MLSNFFIDRPVFATVLSIVIVILGAVTFFQLPIAQYPEVAPPVVQVSAIYPGANAKTVAETVATPIEQEVNGVERMLYMSSRCTNDGQMYLDVTFEVGTNLDMAQVLVQNRVSIAAAKLPQEVTRQGVTTKKKSPAILLCINLISPDASYNQLYLSNFALMNIKDDLARLKGVGDVAFLGPRDYSMRIWLDPNTLADRGMTVNEVVTAIREQNIQVAAGRIGQPPVPEGTNLPFQLTINTQGRIESAEKFGKIIVKTGDRGQNVYLKDVVRKTEGIELGAKNYDVNSYLDGKPAVTLAVFQLPGSNALKTADAIKAKMRELKEKFPAGVDYAIYYDTTVFVNESIHEVFKTLIEAFILVFIVVLVFLQDWRATIIPMIAVPVSLIGTFAVMAMLGFSLNNLSLFGLVLAIGIVVDDAIVVVENVERYLAMGQPAREAVRRAMAEVSGPVIAIALVLCAVFVPTALMAGISGEFFRQFALTIAASTVISAFNSLTLSPALCAILFKGHGAEHGSGTQTHAKKEAMPRLGIVMIAALLAYFMLTPHLSHLLGVQLPGGHGEQETAGHSSAAALWGIRLVCGVAGAAAGWFVAGLVNRGLAAFFAVFNWVFDLAINAYGRTVAVVLRISAIALLIYGGLMGLTYLGFQAVPLGFIPDQDKGYLVINAQLPDGASLDRSDKIIKQMSTVARNAEKVPGVWHTIDLPGYSALLSTNISNVGGMFVILEPFEERKGDPQRSAAAIAAKLREQYREIRGARIAVFGAGDRRPRHHRRIQAPGSRPTRRRPPRPAGGGAKPGRPRQLGPEVDRVVQQFHGEPAATLCGNRPRQAQVAEGIARRRESHAASVPRGPVCQRRYPLQSKLASQRPGRPPLSHARRGYRPAGGPQRRRPASALADPDPHQGLQRAGNRQPLQPLPIRGSEREYGAGHQFWPGRRHHGPTLEGRAPSTMGAEWTEITLQQILAGQDVFTKLAFPLAVLFVFLVLSAQYESWSLPLAIILIVPMCLLASIAGIWLVGLDNNIFTQIGLVVLVGLAAKKRHPNCRVCQATAGPRGRQGRGHCGRVPPATAADPDDLLRLYPRRCAACAGQGRRRRMRVALGVAVFSGMLGVTTFGLFFTPVFYSTIMRFAGKPGSKSPQPNALGEEERK